MELKLSDVVEYKSAAIDGKLSQPANDEKFLAVTFSQDSSSLFITINDATLSGYDDSNGWPDEGKSWLTVNVGQLVTLYSDGGNSGYTSYTVDCAGSSIGGGVTTSSCEPVGGGIYAMVFEVPAATKQFTVTFSAAIVATAAGKPDLSFNFAGQSASITLP